MLHLPRSIVCACVVAITFTLPACDGVAPSGGGTTASSGASSGTSSGGGGDTPESWARENSEWGAEALAESDRGIDEDGEKVWKQEAREFFDTVRYPHNRTFEMPWDWAIDFTHRVYAAGARQVWVTRISDMGLEGHTLYVSDDLLIVLPDDAAQRKAVFDLYHAEMEDEEMRYPDVGQPYIFIVAD